MVPGASPRIAAVGLGYLVAAAGALHVPADLEPDDVTFVALILVSVVFGLLAGRWPAIGLSLLLLVAVAPQGSESALEGVSVFELALAGYVPVAAAGLAGGVAARKVLEHFVAGPLSPSRRPARAQLGWVLTGVDLLGAGVALSVLAWRLFRLGVDASENCERSPCLGAPTTTGRRSEADALYAVSQGLLGLLAIASLLMAATLALRTALRGLADARLFHALVQAGIACVPWAVWVGLWTGGRVDRRRESRARRPPGRAGGR